MTSEIIQRSTVRAVHQTLGETKIDAQKQTTENPNMKYKTDSSNSLDHYLSSIRYIGQPKRTRKLSKLKEYLESQGDVLDHILRVAIIGPGSDIEIEMLSSLFGKLGRNIILQVYCLDISHKLLFALQELVSTYEFLSLELVCADATRLPFSVETFDLIISSSLQHEIFSYRGGIDAVLDSLREYSRLLAKNGLLFIRDFECPLLSNKYAIRFETDDAREFWDNYRRHFRGAYAESVVYEELGNLVVLDSYSATDFMTHFAVKFLYDRAHAQIETWKEINESYITLSSNWYLQRAEDFELRVISTSNDAEPEQEEIIKANISCFLLESGNALRKIPPLCERFNLLLKKRLHKSD